MDIKKQNRERVNNAILECRKALIESTVENLKAIGAEPYQDVLFTKLLFTHSNKRNTTETNVADRISYGYMRNDEPFYMVEMDGRVNGHSDRLPLNCLNDIYEEVCKVVKEY